MITIIKAYKTGLLGRRFWFRNLTAGLIVGVVALPLAMAFAIASGATPAQGLYTAIVASIAVALFGGSSVQIAGPTGAFVVILASITAHYGITGLQIASLMAGAILLLMGIVKLGNLIKFIPDPVIVGFTTGIGFIIFVGEWKDFFGLQPHLALDALFYQKITTLTLALPHLNLTTTGMGLLSLLLVLLTPKIVKRIPGPLVALVVTTALQFFFHFSNVATLGSTFGGIPQHLPTLQIPSISFNEMIQLAGSALTIALLGAIESLLSATAADGMAGTRHDSNQELIGQGIANLLAPLFGGFAATGAIARTATNIRNGGNSPLSAITHAILLLLVLLFLAPLASQIPLCTLAAILFVVAYNMSDLPHFMHILKHAPRYDSLILIITFLLTVFVNLVVAVNVGVILAMLFFINRMSQSVQVSLHKPHSSQQTHLKQNQLSNSETLIYSIQGPLFFAVAEKLENALLSSSTEPKAIILRLNEVPFIDMTGLETLAEVIRRYKTHDVEVYICEANQRVSYKLTRAKITRTLTQKQLFSTLEEAVKASKKEY